MRKASGKRKITPAQKAACQAAFEAECSGDGALKRACPDAVRTQLSAEYALSAEQINRQFQAFTSSRNGAARPGPSGVGAASSKGASNVAGTKYINDQQRAAMMRVFEANANVWGNSLPSATPVNPTEASRPLMDLIRVTGLRRTKLVHHYKQFLDKNNAVLSTSLDERRAEILGRLKLDAVLKHALELAASHPLYANALAKACVDMVRGGRCTADCLTRLNELIELVATRTVCSFNEARAAETSLGFAVLASNKAWVHNADSWMIALGHDGDEASELGVILARSVLTQSLYDALRTALHATRNKVKPFPLPVDVCLRDRRAPVLYYIAGWLLHCIRRDPVSTKGTWQIWLATNSVRGGAKAAAALHLPHDLVTTRSAGGLLYASWRFFHLVWYLEQCYVSSLTMETLCVYGKDALLNVQARLLTDRHVLLMFEKTFPPAYLRSARELLETLGHSGEDLTANLAQQHTALLAELLRMYVRMRGRDAVAKLTAQARLASRDVNSLRSKLAACATAAAAEKQKPVPAAVEKPKPSPTVVADEFPTDEFDEICDAMYEMVGKEAADALLNGQSSWVLGNNATIATDHLEPPADDLMRRIETDNGE